MIDSLFRRIPVVVLGKEAGKRKEQNKEVPTDEKRSLLQEEMVEDRMGVRAEGI